MFKWVNLWTKMICTHQHTPSLQKNACVYNYIYVVNKSPWQTKWERSADWTGSVWCKLGRGQRIQASFVHPNIDIRREHGLLWCGRMFLYHIPPQAAVDTGTTWNRRWQKKPARTNVKMYRCNHGAGGGYSPEKWRTGLKNWSPILSYFLN